ncbi:MAG: hypothetical protein QG597_4277, partial [Actinomycetota bacterium]|nr:hypothetical protein [Actinomycetota bacterium]
MVQSDSSTRTVIPARSASPPQASEFVSQWREQMFGTTCPDGDRQGRPRGAGIEDFQGETGAVRAHLLDTCQRGRTGSEPVNREISEGLERVWLEQERQADAALGADDSTVFRIVLMGRTMSGKSTLFEALTGGDGQRRGDGRQRYTRDVCVKRLDNYPHVELVDTPGVGALDDPGDFALAFEEVPRADLILWVAANDSIQEQTARAIRLLAFMGKPIVIVLNCRMDLNHPGKLADFLADPQFVFADSAGHVQAISRHLAQSGTAAQGFVAVHAEAAWQSHRAPGTSDRLMECSRVSDLETAIRTELEKHREQRTLHRMVDSVRGPVLDANAATMQAAASLNVIAEVELEVSKDLRNRLLRRVDEYQERLGNSNARIIAKRRSWHLSDAADPEGAVEKEWKREGKRLVAEVEKSFDEEGRALLVELDTISGRVADEWKEHGFRTRNLHDLTGLDGAKWNLAAKLGISMLLGAANYFAPAAVGAMIGAVGGPPGVAIGAALGFLVGVATVWLNTGVTTWLDHVWPGHSSRVQQRRNEIGKQLSTLLDDSLDAANKAAKQNAGAVRKQIRKWYRGRKRSNQRARAAAHSWEADVAATREAIRKLDTRTVQEVLRICGRGRLADGVIAATRVPGVACVAAMHERAFTEATLFPAEGLTEPLGVAAAPDESITATSSVLLLLGLTRCGFTVN